MADQWFFVQLNLERIRRSLSRDDRTEYQADYVREWLTRSGFHPVADGWLVREADLGLVDPTEVTRIEGYLGPPPSGV
jgi:hypothetical protein